MFTQLYPLLLHTTVAVTVAAVEGGDAVRLTVMPVRKDEKTDAKHFRPLVVEGQPEELDQELGGALANWVRPQVSIFEQVAEAASTAATAAKKGGSKTQTPAPAAPKALAAAKAPETPQASIDEWGDGGGEKQSPATAAAQAPPVATAAPAKPAVPTLDDGDEDFTVPTLDDEMEDAE